MPAPASTRAACFCLLLVCLGVVPRSSTADEPAAAQRALGDAPARLAAISPDGRLLARGPVTETELWDLDTGRLVHRLSGGIVGDAFSPDGSRILTSDAELGPPYRFFIINAWVWDAKSGAKLATLRIDMVRATHGSFAPDNRLLLTAASGQNGRLWDLASGHELARFEVGADHPNVGFSPTGDVFYAGHGNKLTIRDRRTGREVCHLSAQGGNFFNSAVFVPGGDKLITGHGDGSVVVWNVTNGEAIRKFAAHAGWVSETLVTRDGKRLLTASPDDWNEWKADWSDSPHRLARLWDIQSGELIREFDHDGPITKVQLSDDGSRLLTVWKRPMDREMTNFVDSDHAAALWDVASGKKILHVELTKVPAFALLSRDGKRLFTEGPQLRLWDATTGQMLREFPVAK